MDHSRQGCYERPAAARTTASAADALFELIDDLEPCPAAGQSDRAESPEQFQRPHRSKLASAAATRDAWLYGLPEEICVVVIRELDYD